MATTSESFIRVTEVWVLDRDRACLELMEGIYGNLDVFRKASLEERFALGEGLPGRAWAERRPVLLKELTDENFKRIDVAREVGLTCGMAFPVMVGEIVTGVVVFLCGEVGDSQGAIEIWQARSERPYDMTLADGYYGSLDDFAFISSKTSFRKGFGLPGMVWATCLPAIFKDLSASGVFARSLHANRAEITAALGFPVHCHEDEADVVCLLSSRRMPIAGRYEVWVAGKEKGYLAIHSAFCARRDTHLEDLSDVMVRRGQGMIGRCWLTGTPRICSALDRDYSLPSYSAYDLGFRHSVAVPIAVDGRVSSVLVWYF